VLGCAPELQCIAIEALPGRSVDTLDSHGIVEAMRALGTAVAALHGAPPLEGEPDEDETALDDRTLRLLHPHAAERAQALRVALARSVPAPEPVVCLHGDLHFGNVLVGDRGIGLIDTDLAGGGPAARDLGEIVVRLRLRGRLGALDRLTTADAERSLLEGYGAARDLPSERSLSWHVTHKLTARVFAAVRQVRPELLDRVDDILDEAEEVAGS
jgi:aminoglycoside phosphotransferase (APT) family kinase protein